jgi:hypothetical protein
MHTRKKHDYLGVDMEFKDNGTLKVSMIAYVKNVIAEFPEIIQEKRSPAPAADYHFRIWDEKDVRLLKEERAVAFYHTVAQLLFISTRARHNIQMVIAFLMTRVKAPGEDDWGKLKRLLKHLNGTKYTMLRKLSVEDLVLLKWYVDGLHNAHWDCKGHGREFFTL